MRIIFMLIHVQCPLYFLLVVAGLDCLECGLMYMGTAVGSPCSSDLTGGHWKLLGPAGHNLVTVVNLEGSDGHILATLLQTEG